MYHLTELPAFVSMGKWCAFDPQAKFLPHVNPSNPGKMVDFIRNPEIVERFPDQVRSLMHGCFFRVSFCWNYFECFGMVLCGWFYLVVLVYVCGCPVGDALLFRVE